MPEGLPILYVKSVPGHVQVDGLNTKIGVQQPGIHFLTQAVTAGILVLHVVIVRQVHTPFQM